MSTLDRQQGAAATNGDSGGGDTHDTHDTHDTCKDDGKDDDIVEGGNAGAMA